MFTEDIVWGNQMEKVQKNLIWTTPLWTLFFLGMFMYLPQMLGVLAYVTFNLSLALGALYFLTYKKEERIQAERSKNVPYIF